MRVRYQTVSNKESCEIPIVKTCKLLDLDYTTSEFVEGSLFVRVT